MNKIKQLFMKYNEIISYLFWGVLTTIVNWVTYSVFVVFLEKLPSIETFVSILTANIISWFFATTFAFITNKFFVFHSTKWNIIILILEALKFFSSRLLTGGIESVCVPLLVKMGLNQTLLGIEGSLSKIIVSFVVVMLNYIVSKFLVFKKR